MAAANGLVASLKGALVKALAAQAYATLLAIPGLGGFFALPVVSYVTKALIDKLATWLVQETAVGLSILWIQVEMAYEVKNAEEAKKRLGDMLNNPAKYTEAEQQKISEYFDETTVDIIQLAIKRLS